MWMSASPSHVRMEPPASTVPAGSPAGARQASEATIVRLVSSAALEKQRPQAWGTLLLMGGLFRPGLLQ